MSFSVTGKGVWKLNFRIGGRKPLGHNPLVQNPLTGGSEPGGLCPGGLYARQSWNLAFKSAMCDSVGFTALLLNGGFWSGGVMSGGLCPVTVRTNDVTRDNRTGWLAERRRICYVWPDIPMRMTDVWQFLIREASSTCHNQICLYENLYSPYNGSIIHNRKKRLKT